MENLDELVSFLVCFAWRFRGENMSTLNGPTRAVCAPVVRVMPLIRGSLYYAKGRRGLGGHLRSGSGEGVNGAFWKGLGSGLPQRRVWRGKEEQGLEASP